MAAIPSDAKSPVLANLVVITGFVLVFATFAVDSPAPWVLGVLLIVVGGVWAGVSGRSGGPGDGGAA